MFPVARMSLYENRSVLCSPTAAPNSMFPAYLGVPCISTIEGSGNVAPRPLSKVGCCFGNATLAPTPQPVSPCCRTSGSFGGGGGGCWIVGRDAEPGGACRSSGLGGCCACPQRDPQASRP